MRINKIKLSGFKSFVDPATLSLPGDLTGVVGPNGCGKSNIIDAMIWVLGESSAKHLRGDSMTDVIFNGSNSRKPVGQAVVEIIFDNSDRTIGGQYASFNEISIKRILGRDAISNYYLNGTRCRRKDITDIFLGTGIGPRGYSVIEQGMISRVIEGKPEELRAFLEEAAGISKYRERRRETESRIRQAEENIERLSDIRDELNKQLRHLKRQASAAERYKELKGEERKLNARTIVENWRKVQESNDKNNTDKAKKETAVESVNATVLSIEARQEESREKQVVATEDFNTRQADFYTKSSDISRTEQSLMFFEEKETSFKKEITDVAAQLMEVDKAILQAQETQLQKAKELKEIAPQLKINTEKVEEKDLSLKQAENDLEAWQKGWDEFNLISNQASQDDNSLKIRLEHLSNTIPTKNTRKKEVVKELQKDVEAEVENELLSARKRVQEITEMGLDMERERARVNQELDQSRTNLETLVNDLHDKELSLEKQKGELGSLKALVEKELGGGQEAVTAWFGRAGVKSKGRLVDLVKIETGWEQAVEAALRVPLNAFCGDSMVENFFNEELTPMQDYKITVLDTEDYLSPNAEKRYPLLSERVTGPVNMRPFLEGVYTAESENEALRIREQLSIHELVVTKRGTIFAKKWAQSPDESGDAVTILAIERQIRELDAGIEVAQAFTNTGKEDVQFGQIGITRLEEKLKQLNVVNEKSSSELRFERELLNKREANFQVGRVRLQSLEEEISRIDLELDEDNRLLATLTHEHGLSQENVARIAETREAQLATKNHVQAHVDSERKSRSSAKEDVHSTELSYEFLKQASATSLKDVSQSIAIRDGLASRLTTLKSELSLLVEPRNQEEKKLETALSSKLLSETALTEARNLLEGYNQELGLMTSERADAENQLSDLKPQLEEARLEERTFLVQLAELMTRFEETGEVFDDIVSELDELDGATGVTEQLEKIRNRIGKLEPINLAAIEEFEELSERKIYLDNQDSDLVQALNTLKGAIRKIDGETKARFKETYDGVNEKLQEMFPVLFGGGEAYLEMTGDDLLETGVTVMARPPGKRNSSIHLLSGGEKALTALAFIFAIFELNPAPFCLLDEVDAPLDDANAVRLTTLLKSMSETVQFLFVTHNKITMEIAEQLIGVTMQEAGVSRFVSVNIDKAVELAATA